MNYEQFHDRAIEIETLGTMMNDYSCLNKGMMILDEECFWNTSEKLLFNTMKRMWSKNESITIATLYKELGKEASVVGIENLTNIFSYTFGKSQFDTLSKKLIDFKKAYKTFKISEKIQKMFLEEKSYKDVVGEISEAIDNLNSNSDIENGDSIKIYETSKKNLKDRCENGSLISGISTGFKSLDEKINGLKKSEMIVIAGRPAMGKTTVASNIGVNVAKAGKKVAMFTLEMSSEQMMNKILSSLTGIEFYKIEKGLLSANDWKLINQNDSKAREIFKNLKIYERTQTLNNIIAQCRNLSKKGQLDLMIVDYLQLTEYKSSGNINREQEVSRISRAFKLLSSELKIPVIALSQLSRSPEQRADHRPIMSDLRESGGIENDSNVVLMCYRDEYYNKESEEKGIIELICVKNRNGTTGTIKMAWLPDYQLIDDIYFEKKEEAPF